MFETVLMDEDLFYRHLQQIGYIHCKFKRWSASAVFYGADSLSRYAQHLDQIPLPYLFLFSDLCEIVFHESP